MEVTSLDDLLGPILLLFPSEPVPVALTASHVSITLVSVLIAPLPRPDIDASVLARAVPAHVNQVCVEGIDE